MHRFRRLTAVLTMCMIVVACAPTDPTPPTPPEHTVLRPTPPLWMRTHAKDHPTCAVASVDSRSTTVARW